MRQIALFEEAQNLDSTSIVNVASVPQRSLFRYPGGKTWLVPRVRKWLRNLRHHPHELLEPFAGGGIIGLTAAFEQLADHVTLVERDDEVAAVWHTLIYGDGAWLAQQIAQFALTPASVKATLATTSLTTPEKAFQTILKNRVQRGGILAPGAGLVKSGEDGKGITSRWYPETLKKRILDIMAIRQRITFIEGDGVSILREYTQREDTAIFIDPPYTVAGKKAGSRLYKCSELNHDELFACAASLRSDFLMTYDDAQGVHELADRYGFDREVIAMKNTHHAKMTELLISRDLDWLRR